METPQLENGYTRIAHQVLLDLASYRINGQERQILDVIFYKTYGFHKKKDWISLSQFHELTGMSKSGIVRSIKGLVDKNIVIKEDNGKVALYYYNKIKPTWKPLSKKITYNRSLSKKITPLSKKITTIIKDDKKNYQRRVLHNIQDNITKDTNTKDIGTFLQMFSQVNPSYKNLFKNKTERASASRLLEQYGMEKITNLMGQLPAIIQKPYAPSITTPYQLEVKMGQLILFMQQEKLKVTKNYGKSKRVYDATK